MPNRYAAIRQTFVPVRGVIRGVMPANAQTCPDLRISVIRGDTSNRYGFRPRITPTYHLAPINLSLNCRTMAVRLSCEPLTPAARR